MIYLPKGRYAFEISDGSGRPNIFSNLSVSRDTSINFMFATRKEAPTATLTAARTRIQKGEKVTLSWLAEAGTSVRINPGIGNVDSRGSVTVSPSFTTTYSLSASNSNGTVSRSVTIVVSDVRSEAPAATLRASSTTTKKGGSVTLTWVTENGTSVRIEPGIGNVSSSGSRKVTPASSTTYLLTASNTYGSVTKRVTVRVTPTNAVGPTTPTPTPTVTTTTPTPRVTPVTSTPTPKPSVSPKPSILQVKPTPVPSPPVVGGSGFPYLNVVIPAAIILLLGGLIWFFWPTLLAILPWAAGLLSGLGIAGKVASDADEVHCTLFAPSEVSAGTDILIQIYAHLLEQAEELLELAQELEPEAKEQLSKKLKKEVKRKSVLTFKLMVPGIELAEEEQDIVWEGEPESVEFIIPIPEDHPVGKRFGRVFVYSNGEEIGKIPFRINILPRALQLDPSAVETKVGGVMTQNPTAFVSYASRDKDKVYRFVQLMDVLKYDFHIDIFHIDAGERWEQKLYEFIDKDDVFLLFWSDAASQSEWVIKEAKLAKDRMSKNKKGLPRIIIYKLDEGTQVPEWLQDIHVDRKWAEIIGTIESQK